MDKPQLPILKAIKKNNYTGKYIIPLTIKESIQIDPRFFAFYPSTNLSGKVQSKGFRHDTVMNGAYTSNISVHEIEKFDENIEQILKDLVALSNYSKKYQKYLKEAKNGYNKTK